MTEDKDNKINQLDTLIEMAALINSTLDPVSIRKKAIEAATKLLDAEAGSLLLLDPETGELFFEVALGEKGDRMKSIRLAKGLGVAGWVAENDEPVIINDLSADPRFYKGADKESGFQTRNMVCVPVRSKERIIGVLQAINKKEGIFETDDMSMLYALANQVAVAIENAFLYRDSITDGLTGLYHHKFFELRMGEEVDRAKRYKHNMVLIMIDIDFFKKVNDTYGHLAGDSVLRGVAAILKRGTRMSDIVARYGGEEFAAILPYTSYENALEVAERLRSAVEKNDFNGIKVTISLGLGYFEWKNQDIEYRALIAFADRALYKAKANGRNRIEILIAEKENA
ncbi:MAG: sensor domain-containing diguanylate cyclase [Thermodesulfovibrionia bacterium]|nr:sensor domain-containing diguanylate cyclase [Thermodesulfovibrionia bacterium]